MGILDDLREQASQKQEEQQEDSIAKEKLEHNYQILILPKMQQLFSYFKELLDYLNIIEEPIVIPHYSKRYEQLGELQQQDYRLSSDRHGGIANFEKLTEVTLRFYCLGKEEGEEFVHYADNKVEAEQEKDFLSRRKVKYHYDRHMGNTKGGAVTFHITRKIPVIFKFSVDYDRSQIILSMQNHENFELRTQRIDPEHIDESFMDKLARYILRKDNEFLRMDIDEAHKEHIRLQLEEQKRRHAEELAAAHIREQKEQDSAEKNKLSNKFKEFIKSSKR